MLSGSESSVLSFPDITTRDAGKYQLIATNNYGSITSSIVTLTVETNQLINVAVNPGAGRNSYKGLAVLPGTTNDIWTDIDARTSITNAPLFDSTGTITPVRLTLIKLGNDSSALPHPLLGGISYASSQVVVLKNLLPNEFYDLVVYSVGGQPNEGGVFSGDVKGVARGYAKAGVNPPGFAKDINYVENPWAQSDSDGTLTFTIRPNATVLLNGYRNCDFNGLQLRER